MSCKEPGMWWVSPSNYDEEVRGSFAFAPRIEILDTTLRDSRRCPSALASPPSEP